MIFFENSFNSVKTNVHKKIIELYDKRISLSFEEIKKGLLKTTDLFNENKKVKISDVIIYEALKELIETDVLIENKNYKKTNNKQYVLSDLYCFYHLRMKNNDFSNQTYRVLNGLSFEIMVRRNINLLMGYAQRNFDFETFRINGENYQIDLVVDYKSNQHFSLIECKNYHDIYKLDYLEERKILNRLEELEKELKKKKNRN